MPQPKQDIQRDKRLVVFLTADDHYNFSQISRALGMRSPGALASKIIEESLISGFDPELMNPLFQHISNSEPILTKCAKPEGVVNRKPISF